MARLAFDPALLDNRYALPPRLWQLAAAAPAASAAAATGATVDDSIVGATTAAQIQLAYDYARQRMTTAGL